MGRRGQSELIVSIGMIVLLRQGDSVYMLELSMERVRLWEIVPGQIEVEGIVILEEERDEEVREEEDLLGGVQDEDVLEEEDREEEVHHGGDVAEHDRDEEHVREREM